MSLSTFTINGVVVETTQPLESVLPILLGNTHAVSAAPLQETAKQTRRTTPKAPKAPKQSKAATASTARKAKPTRSEAVDRKALLAEVRSLTRQGQFDEARRITPKGWLQMFDEIDRAEARRSAKAEAALAQEPKAAGEPKSTKSAKSAKPKSTKSKQSKKAPTEKVALPTATEGVEVIRTVLPESEAMIEWKLRFSTKVADLVAGGDLDEIVSAWAELTEMVEVLDAQEDGVSVHKACHLADLTQVLSDAAASIRS